MLLYTLLSTALAANPGIIKLDHVQHFTLQSAADYAWKADEPKFTQGTVFVVEVEAAKAVVRQVGGPVLYVGAVPAARANPGHHDGHVVAFVPGHIDLHAVPIYWGPSDLPEQVTQKDGAEALASSDAKPLPSVQVANALVQPVQLDSNEHLFSHMADLIDKHAPMDASFAHGYRLAYGQ